ncbi:TLR adapter interacting with SLC15A4 on the lysosome-like isoform X1 [Falco biarmicus]|uniref:TLR adapter interacting with SLC15A4 on the lysosome-like isoform X1 n=1 Tax=Falco biarmicus TaxID=345155 RepID=UPI0024BCB85E|nr:TLR adapter interacting with SLC15A4 on the lysosome-like isoform X1 [Falco biarmicus]
MTLWQLATHQRCTTIGNISSFFFLTSSFRSSVTLYSKTTRFSSGITSVLEGKKWGTKSCVWKVFFHIDSSKERVCKNLFSYSSCSRRVLGYVIICLSHPTRIGPHGTLVIRLLLTLVVMLAEGILTSLIYKESCHQDKPRRSHASRKVEEGIWRQKLVDKPKIKGFADGCEKQSEISARGSKMEHRGGPQRRSIQEAPPKDQKTLVKGTVSPALHIPKREQNTEQMDLYRSWSCNSIYQNYPDLHIGGDRVGGHTCDSGCVLDHVCDELPDGPVLLSIDIPLGPSPLCEHPERPNIKSLCGDEAGDRSIILCEEPLSNSVLNKYMETKVAELYKQFFEENLTRCGSVTNLLTSSLIRNNVYQLSFQISQEQSIETSKAREVLLHSLALFSLHTTHRNSSEFSTPSLQISNPACMKKSGRMQFTS